MGQFSVLFGSGGHDGHTGAEAPQMQLQHGGAADQDIQGKQTEHPGSGQVAEAGEGAV